MDIKKDININNLNKYKIMNSTKIKDYYKDINPFVDLVVTSPPYYDAKVYNDGNSEETGFNQTYEEYLNDIKVTFEGVFNICKESASLYLNIDTVKRNGSIRRLPDDIANILEEIGWIHKDTIIWDKVKTLPYSRKGQARNVFEYIMLFTKSNTEYKYYEDRIKSIEPMHWWIKHPEKYSPNGIAPSNIWRFSIPPQGSWGARASNDKAVLKHACPFPPEMLTRIILLASDIDDVVLDPYAGTGILLATAEKLNRNYIGFDISRSSMELFNITSKKFVNDKWGEIEAYYRFQENIKPLYYKTIINLRIMKYAKILLKRINESIESCNKDSILGCIVTDHKNIDSKKYADVEYLIIIDREECKNKIEAVLNDIINKPPLSKYGINAKGLLVTKRQLEDRIKVLKQPLYVYKDWNIENYSDKVTDVTVVIDILESIDKVIISNISLNYSEYKVLLEETKEIEKVKSYKKLCEVYKY